MFIFLYGNDIFRSTEKLKYLKEKFIEKNTSNASSSVFDFNENDSFEKMQSILRAESLFSSKKIIVIKSAINSADKTTQDKIVEYIESGDGSNDNVLIFWEENEPRKNNKLFKTMISKCKSEKFDKLAGVNLSNWIKEEFEARNITAGNSSINKLISFVGDDLFQMKNEIDKLSSFAKNKNLKEEDIELLVKSKVEANIFETVEAIGAKDKNKALKLFHDQIEQGDDPFYILSMYVYQFRNLLKIGSFYFDGISDRDIIAKETKLHPFVVQKGMQQLRDFSIQKLKLIYKELEKLDSGIKTGKVEIVDAMDRFIMKI